MLINIIQIGNSQGIRLPKSILEQLQIDTKVDMEIEDDKIILKSVNKSPRKNWEKKFEQMHLNSDDKLFIEDSVDLDMEDWEW
jgi:antitoxin MazE